jgi:hypothetical protein
MRSSFAEVLWVAASVTPSLQLLLTFFKLEPSTTAADARRRMSGSRREPISSGFPPTETAKTLAAIDRIDSR